MSTKLTDNKMPARWDIVLACLLKICADINQGSMVLDKAEWLLPSH